MRAAPFLLLAALAACDRPHDAAWTPARPVPVAPRGPVRSNGCSKADPPSGVVEQRFQALGRSRTATIIAPIQVGPSYPVVFVLHGDGGSGNQIRHAFHLEEQANGRALFVYPDGMVDLDTETTKNPDVAVFDSLLAYVQSTWCVDTNRIFVAGFSKGAYMANQLACRRGDQIRGIAAHSGGGPYENKGQYDDQGNLLCHGKPVASLVIHGLADGLVMPSEGQNSLDHWSWANQCGDTRTTRGACIARGGCLNDVVECKIPGLGHALWPQAAPVIWQFFDGLK